MQLGWLIIWIAALCAARTACSLGQPQDLDVSTPRTIVFGADENFPPFSMVDPVTKKPTGFEIELIEEIGKVAGFRVEFRLGAWEEIRRAFVAGEIDSVEMWDAPTRRTWALFSEPFAAGESALFVRSTGTRFRSIDELGDTPVGVEKGALSQEILRAEHPKVRYIEYASGVDAVLDVASGKLEAALTGRLPGEAIIRERNLRDVVITGAPLNISKICFCVRPGNEALLAEINKGLSILQRSGRYNEIRNRWLGPEASSRRWVMAVAWVGALAGVAAGAAVIVLAWNSSLRRRVAKQAMALELAMSKRRQAEEAAAKAKRLDSLGKITGRIAHDVNNVLTAVMGTAHLLRGNPKLDTQEHKLLDGLLAAADQGTTLTRQLVAFSHGTLSRRQLVDLSTLVVELPRSGIVKLPTSTDLSVSVPEVPLVAFADPSLLEQLVVGLIAAAAEGPEQSVCEFIEVQLTAKGDQAVVRVVAVGRAMEPDLHERLFDPLELEIKATIAFGLASAQSLAHSLGGAIHIDPDHSRGVVFVLTLPLATGQDAGPAPTEPRRGASAKPAKILVVEDNAGVRQLVVLQLARLGFEVVETDNGLAAIELASQARFEVLVTDVVLPGCNGPEVIRRVRERHPEIAVVLMSGYAEHAQDADAVMQPRDRILPKPFGVAELERAVRESLGDQHPVHTPNGREGASAADSATG